MMKSATGESQKQSGLRNHAAMTSAAAPTNTSNHALKRLSWRCGRCRMAVRGLAASNLRSTMRLNAIAAVRAPTIASRISNNVRHSGTGAVPSSLSNATSMEASANGSAKIVCENFTNSPSLSR